jgi:hypothetical protein
LSIELLHSVMRLHTNVVCASAAVVAVLALQATQASAAWSGESMGVGTHLARFTSLLVCAIDPLTHEVLSCCMCAWFQNNLIVGNTPCSLRIDPPSSHMPIA